MKTNKSIITLMAVVVACGAIVGGVTLTDQYTDYNVNPVGEVDAVAVTTAIAAGMVVGTIAGAAVGSYLSDDVDEQKLAKIDALETKKEIYSASATQKANNENMLTSFRNHLEDTKTVARMAGKNAYVRALENGSTKTDAEIAARDAIADYYSGRQMALIKQWNITTQQLANSKATINNNSNISGGYLDQKIDQTQYTSWSRNRYIALFHNRTTTLENNTDVGVNHIYVMVDPDTYEYDTVSIDDDIINTGSTNNIHLYGYYQKGPTTDYDDIPRYINVTKFHNTWTDLKTKENEVQTNLENFVNATYDGYQKGDISKEDLVDPYLAARNYSPEGNFGTWTIRTYASMGYEVPNRLSGIGNMTVNENGTSYTGILLSDGLPNNDEFVVNQSYNPSNLTGSQYMMDEVDGTTTELTENFTIEKINTANGSMQNSVKYTNVSYDASDISGYKQRMQKLQNLTAEVNAWQKEARTSGGGTITDLFSGLIPSLNGTQTLIVMILVIMGIGFVTRS